MNTSLTSTCYYTSAVPVLSVWFYNVHLSLSLSLSLLAVFKLVYLNNSATIHLVKATYKTKSRCVFKYVMQYPLLIGSQLITEESHGVN